mgnify:CR=1 FL=1
MKRVAALLLCVLLCASLAVSAGAQPQKLLYPGTVIAGDHVYLVGIPLEGGNIRVTANGQEIPANVVSVAGAQLGVTYYCVVSTTSSMSQLQQDQQRAGLNAINDALKGTTDELQQSLTGFNATVDCFNQGVRDFSEFDYNLRGTVEKMDVAVRDLTAAIRRVARNTEGSEKK